MSVKEVAKALRVCNTTVYEMVERGGDARKDEQCDSGGGPGESLKGH